MKRADCMGPGLCLKLSCRWNTTLDVTETGAIKLNAPFGNNRSKLDSRSMGFDERVLERLEELETNCALDYADQGGIPIDEIRDVLGLGHEQMNEVVKKIIRKTRHNQGFRRLVDEL